MGVKDLWTILSPVCERKSLWELQDKTIAVDLSGWVCDSQNVGEHTTQPRMYLRNLFFRTTCLLLLGAKPVFVLEGTAPILKHDTIARRKKLRSKKDTVTASQIQTTKKGNRSRLQSLLKQCNELLNIMGLSCIQSPGEAEALCALLDHTGLVDGCISQDSDCLLYGAQTVYRNFTISPMAGKAGFSVDVYKMEEVQEKLSLGRDKLIAMSLLCGCDYNEKGVAGVGKETVMKFLGMIKDQNVLNRLKKWRTNSYFEELEQARAEVTKGISCEKCGHVGRRQKHDKSGCIDCRQSTGCIQDSSRLALIDPVVVAELNVRKKALLNADFPSEALLQEFLQEDVLPPSNLQTSWKRPDLISFIKYSVIKLSWTEDYALEKFLPLITRWQLLHARATEELKCHSSVILSPENIVKTRVSRGVPSYEIQWSGKGDCLKNLIIEKDSLQTMLVTVEPQTLVQEAYPELVSAFLALKAAKAKKSKTGKTRAKKKDCLTKCTCESKENGGCSHVDNQGKLDKFLVKKQTNICGVESMFEKLSLEQKRDITSAVPNTKNKGVNRKTLKHKNMNNNDIQLKLTTFLKDLKLSDKDNKSVVMGKENIQSLEPICKGATQSTQQSHSSEGIVGNSSTGIQNDKLNQSASISEECSFNHSNCEDCELCMNSNDSDLDLSAIIQDIVGYDKYHTEDNRTNEPLHKNKIKDGTGTCENPCINFDLEFPDLEFSDISKDLHNESNISANIRV